MNLLAPHLSILAVIQPAGQPDCSVPSVQDEEGAALGVSPLMTPGSHEACFTRSASLAEAFLKA